MTDLPPPDVMDQSGRMRRLVLALLVGAAAAAIAFFICDSMAKPDTMVADGVYTAGHVARAYKFVYYFTALAGVVAFSITLLIANRIADKRWREAQVARAKVV